MAGQYDSLVPSSAQLSQLEADPTKYSLAQNTSPLWQNFQGGAPAWAPRSLVGADGNTVQGVQSQGNPFAPGVAPELYSGGLNQRQGVSLPYTAGANGSIASVDPSKEAVSTAPGYSLLSDVLLPALQVFGMTAGIGGALGDLGVGAYGAGAGTAAAPAAASAGSSALDWNTIPSVGGAGVGADVGAGTGLTSQGMTTSLGGNLGTMPAGGLTTNTAAGGIGSATAAGLPAGTSTSLGGANFATGAGIGGAAAGGINPSSAVPTPTGGGSSGTAPIVDKSTQASAADIASANKGGIMQTLGLQDASGKINPLNAIGAGMMGLNVYNQAQAKKQASDFAAQMKAMGAPLTAAANQLLQLYASGQLLPSDQFKVQQFSQQQKSQLKNYYAQAGLGDSAMLQSALQQVDSMAAAMQSKMEQAYLSNASNVATQGNQYTMAGIQQQIATDQKLSDAQMNLLSTLAQLSAKQNNTTTATKP